MGTRLIWDEAKRLANLDKHGLDFADADGVLDSPYRFDISATRECEARIQSMAYVFNVLAVLSVAHTERADAVRVVSFRRASAREREAYYEWLETQFED